MNNGISTSVFGALGFGFSLKFPLQFASGKVPQSSILNHKLGLRFTLPSIYPFSVLPIQLLNFSYMLLIFFFTSQLVLSYSSNTVPYHKYMASQAALVVKNLPANAQDEGSIPGLGRSPRVRNANPLQYFCLGNHMDWRATVHEVAKSQTWLSTEHIQYIYDVPCIQSCAIYQG